MFKFSILDKEYLITEESSQLPFYKLSSDDSFTHSRQLVDYLNNKKLKPEWLDTLELSEFTLYSDNITIEVVPPSDDDLDVDLDDIIEEYIQKLQK
jgi:hypothetical protein